MTDVEAAAVAADSDRPRTPNTIMRTPVPPMRPSPSIVKIRPRTKPSQEQQEADLFNIEERQRQRLEAEEQRDRTKVDVAFLSEDAVISPRRASPEDQEVLGREAIERAEWRAWMAVEVEHRSNFELARDRARKRVLALSSALQQEEAEKREPFYPAEEREWCEIIRSERVNRPWQMDMQRFGEAAPAPSQEQQRIEDGKKQPIAARPPQSAGEGHGDAFRGRTAWAEEKVERFYANKRHHRRSDLEAEQMAARAVVECEELKAFMAIEQDEIVAMSTAKRMQQVREHEEKHGTDFATGRPSPQTIHRRRVAAANRIQRLGREYCARRAVEKKQKAAKEFYVTESNRLEAALVCQRAIRSCLARCARRAKAETTAATRSTEAATEAAEAHTLVIQAFAYPFQSAMAYNARVEAAVQYLNEMERREQQRVAYQMYVEKLTMVECLVEFSEGLRDGRNPNERRRSSVAGDAEKPKGFGIPVDGSTDLPYLRAVVGQQRNPVNTRNLTSPPDDWVEPRRPYRAIELFSKALLAKSETDRRPSSFTPAPNDVGMSLLSLMRSATITSEGPLPDVCRVLAREDISIPQKQVDLLDKYQEEAAARSDSRRTSEVASTQSATLEALLQANRQAYLDTALDRGTPFSADWLRNNLWKIQEHHSDVANFIELSPPRQTMYEGISEFEAEEIREVENNEMLDREKLIEEQIDNFVEAFDFLNEKLEKARDKKRREDRIRAIEQSHLAGDE